MTLAPEETLKNERQWARPASLTATGGAVLVLVSVVVEGSGLIEGDNDAEQLRSLHDNAGALLGVSVARAIGLALLTIPLLYLFRAAQARSDAVRAPLIGFVFIGPLLFAIQTIVGYVASQDIASQFVDQAPAGAAAAERFADGLIDDSSLRQVAAALLLPALLGMVIAMVYIPLQAMRTGLLTRFWGTLAMALGATLIILPLVPLIGLMVWFIFLGLLFLDRWPGGRPPAWAEGRAIPWPKPGEEPEKQDVSKEPESRAEDQP